MIRSLDRACGWLLAAFALLHAVGSYEGYRSMPQTLLWALAASVCELLLAGINLLRAERRNDRSLAALSAAGSVAWLTIIVSFGVIIGNAADIRVVVQGTITLLTVAFSVRTLLLPVSRAAPYNPATR